MLLHGDEKKIQIFKRPCSVLYCSKHQYENTKPFQLILLAVVFCCKKHNLLCSLRNSDLFKCEYNM